MYRNSMLEVEEMKINKELLKGSTTVLILSLLNRKNMYGYEMIKEIELKSKNVFSFKEGTLYPILHSLENENYIESYWDSSQGARKRKYYKITDSGKKILSEKEQEWKLFSSTVNNVLWEANLCQN
jgi:PadR family transcriptional regulator, regulatory protein PadR